MPSGSQKAIDRYAKSPVDGLPLRRANRLEQRSVGRRQAEPSQMQDALRALDFGRAQLFAALGVSPTSHDPVNFAATGVWSFSRPRAALSAWFALERLCPVKWSQPGSNRRPPACKAGAVLLKPMNTGVWVGQSGVIAGETDQCGTQSGTRSHVVLMWYSVLK